MEALKDRKKLVDVLRRNADAIVLNPKADKAAALGCPRFDARGAVAGNKFQCIREQVNDDEIERGAIGEDGALNA